MQKDLNYYREINPYRVDPNVHINLIQPDISGGKINKESIDVIAQHPNATEITISGLSQDTFEYFIARYARQFESIIFWKCPHIENLRMLEVLFSVKHLVFFWNQRAERLWDLSKTKSLIGLSLDDFTRLHDLTEISYSTSLEELVFGDRVWDTFILNSLSPLSECPTIRHLSFSAKKILDCQIEPLADIKNISSLEFSRRLFTTEQIAWLKAHLPACIKSMVMQPYWKIDEPIEWGNGKMKSIFITGKGKPFLDPVQDKKRMDKYIDDFNRMYEWYLANPAAKPEEYSR